MLDVITARPRNVLECGSRERRRFDDVSWGWVDGFKPFDWRRSPFVFIPPDATGPLPRPESVNATPYDGDMSAEGLRRAIAKMRAAGVAPPAIEAFGHYYQQLADGATGLIPEASIEPMAAPVTPADAPADEEACRAALAQTVIVKLNGGLGTSMGLDRAKTLLPVREGKSFLDLLVEQVLRARERYGVRLPLLLMDSFRTSGDTLDALRAYPELAVADLPLEFLQSQEPKLLADSLDPVEWPADPGLEWCPPGHGDVYASLLGTGILDRLLELGFRYATIANGDNLGAAPDAGLTGWFAASGAPYAAEACVRTVNDRKGGHLAVRKADGRLILRDSAQTPTQDQGYFADESRHRYFHTNNLWLNLPALRSALTQRNGVLGLPLIRNAKTVDPRDSSTPKVIQIESAMGAAIEVFPGASAVLVERGRFLPVKTTNELLLVRSDAYELTEDARLVAVVDKQPEVNLDPAFYGKLPDFEARIPNPPSLRDARSLTVRGDWHFGRGVRVVGDVLLEGGGSVPDGAVLGAR